MDPTLGQQGSSAATPLQPASSDRVNQQREPSSAASATRRGDDGIDSTVHEKINQFNTLAMQSKQLERKTADAALKRAMLGREEAETEMRRYRDEARALRKQVEEGKERERRVGERLEAVMENYGRTKETHTHTQALWEKEIRRARKETFKCQSVIVKLQEELKSARAAAKSTEEMLSTEKERSNTREQEAFAARYSLVGVQEQLEQALERLKIVEQERDAFKALADNEEDIARIASEGRLPLPPSQSGPEDDEFASPKKPRVSSISAADIRSSAANETETDELTLLWQWEKQRADRAVDHVEFLQTECELRCCPCANSRARSNTVGPASPRRRRSDTRETTDAGGPPSSDAPPGKCKVDKLRAEGRSKEPRRSTIFIPAEGIFRTVSEQEAQALESAPAPEAAAALETAPKEEASRTGGASVDERPTSSRETCRDPPCYARTPSVEPPDFAVISQPRISLLSLLDAPHRLYENNRALLNVPTMPAPATAEPAHVRCGLEHYGAPQDQDAEAGRASGTARQSPAGQDNAATASQADPVEPTTAAGAYGAAPCAAGAERAGPSATEVGVAEACPGGTDGAVDNDFYARPHTAAAFYTTTTTTTKVPLREETSDPSLASRLLAMQRTPSAPTFDANNPALTPTMTREQALAQIRARRGRARSAAGQGAAATPKRQMLDRARRDVSAPTGKVGRVASAPRTVR